MSSIARDHGQGGFTLIEVMVALVVLTVGILSLQRMQVSAIQGNATAQRLTSGTSWAADRAERLFSLPYNDPLLNDSDGDGTNQDPDGDGGDNDGGNFGLDDTGAGGVVTADFLFTRDALGNDVVTLNGNPIPANTLDYFVYWNVAVDRQVPNTRTIRVITVWGDRGLQKTTVVDHVKPNAL